MVARACRDAGFTPAIRYVSRDPLANRALVARGLAVSLTPAGLAGALHGIAVVDVDVADAPSRDVFALLPAAGVTALARNFVDVLALR